ncbi:MAG: helix-turn-helix transcriptional regulator, partial [Alphaproteobacteria bacterium]|nr:helix-turn-helix transcriptional regulator [Alphaproteobacteria bacterium]
FFAEVGFGGQTRELARRLGITQPLLYRYFPTKQDLVERVYEEVYVRRWEPRWTRLIADRARPLRARLNEFYAEYGASVLTREWMRIYMFAALAGAAINQRYTALIERALLAPVCAELRAEAGLPSPDEVPLDDAEIELAWAMHSAIFYYYVRKQIYAARVVPDAAAVVAQTVDAMLDGTPAVLRRVVVAAARDR